MEALDSIRSTNRYYYTTTETDKEDNRIYMHRHTWLFGLLLQTLWLLWIVVAKEWGFLPMNIAFWIIYTRNHFLWKVKLDKNHIKLN
jgi:hypothetical protein